MRLHVITQYQPMNALSFRTHSRRTWFKPLRVEATSDFNAAAYEAERQRLDAAARESMASVAEVEGEDLRAWKWVIRKRVWDEMEARNVAQFPRPVHHRIPNFVGANLAANKGDTCPGNFIRPFSLFSTHSRRTSLKPLRVEATSDFNAAGYEAERHRLDAEARENMAAVAEVEGEDPRAWKWVIRKRVWDEMEARNVAQFPRPVHHRISNFVGANVAANKMSELEVFKGAKCVKVNPDSPQKQVRFLTLNGGKKLLTPQPRLRTGFFSVLESSFLNSSTINEACTSVGVAKYGKPIGLDEKIKVDLIVIGSVAVDPKTGARLGKGEGFAELEYGMLRYMGAIDDSTPVVTSVHDQQLVDDIPVEKLLIHDVPVDIICTPTQVIFTNTAIPKPQEKLGQIRILRELKSKIEQETGQQLPSGPSEKLPPTAKRKR